MEFWGSGLQVCLSRSQLWLMFILGASPFEVTALGFKVRRLPSKVRILRFVTGPKEYTARVLIFVIENSSRQGWNADVSGWNSWSELEF